MVFIKNSYIFNFFNLGWYARCVTIQWTYFTNISWFFFSNRDVHVQNTVKIPGRLITTFSPPCKSRERGKISFPVPFPVQWWETPVVTDQDGVWRSSQISKPVPVRGKWEFNFSTGIKPVSRHVTRFSKKKTFGTVIQTGKNSF